MTDAAIPTPASLSAMDDVALLGVGYASIKRAAIDDDRSTEWLRAAEAAFAIVNDRGANEAAIAGQAVTLCELGEIDRAIDLAHQASPTGTAMELLLSHLEGAGKIGATAVMLAAHERGNAMASRRLVERLAAIATMQDLRPSEPVVPSSTRQTASALVWSSGGSPRITPTDAMALVDDACSRHPASRGDQPGGGDADGDHLAHVVDYVNLLGDCHRLLRTIIEPLRLGTASPMVANTLGLLGEPLDPATAASLRSRLDALREEFLAITSGPLYQQAMTDPTLHGAAPGHEIIARTMALQHYPHEATTEDDDWALAAARNGNLAPVLAITTALSHLAAASSDGGPAASTDLLGHAEVLEDRAQRAGAEGIAAHRTHRLLATATVALHRLAAQRADPSSDPSSLIALATEARTAALRSAIIEAGTGDPSILADLLDTSIHPLGAEDAATVQHLVATDRSGLLRAANRRRACFEDVMDAYRSGDLAAMARTTLLAIESEPEDALPLLTRVLPFMTAASVRHASPSDDLTDQPLERVALRTAMSDAVCALGRRDPLRPLPFRSLTSRVLPDLGSPLERRRGTMPAAVAAGAVAAAHLAGAEDEAAIEHALLEAQDALDVADGLDVPTVGDAATVARLRYGIASVVQVAMARRFDMVDLPASAVTLHQRIADLAVRTLDDLAPHLGVASAQLRPIDGLPGGDVTAVIDSILGLLDGRSSDLTAALAPSDLPSNGSNALPTYPQLTTRACRAIQSAMTATTVPDTTRAVVQRRLGEALRSCGDRDAAYQHLRRAVQLDPSPSTAIAFGGLLQDDERPLIAVAGLGPDARRRATAASRARRRDSVTRSTAATGNPSAGSDTTAKPSFPPPPSTPRSARPRPSHNPGDGLC